MRRLRSLRRGHDVLRRVVSSRGFGVLPLVQRAPYLLRGVHEVLDPGPGGEHGALGGELRLLLRGAERLGSFVVFPDDLGQLREAVADVREAADDFLEVGVDVLDVLRGLHELAPRPADRPADVLVHRLRLLTRLLLDLGNLVDRLAPEELVDVPLDPRLDLRGGGAVLAVGVVLHELGRRGGGFPGLLRHIHGPSLAVKRDEGKLFKVTLGNGDLGSTPSGPLLLNIGLSIFGNST